MSSGQIVLFDIPSKAPRAAWSLNPWKSMLEYPDIKPTLESHLPANPSTGAWTIPTVKFSDGTYLMDSRRIVSRIEESHPEPPIHLDSPTLPKLEAIMSRLMEALQPIYLLAVPRELLSERGVEYWYSTRQERAGMPLEQLDKECGGQIAWNAGQPILHEVEALLKESQDGPFFLGKTVSYADFVWVGFLIFMQRIGGIDELYKISGDIQLHNDILEGTAPWHKRNDY
ncbi:hypothetical protein G7Z17_g3377 [Cylindrodendrum hubeiense]|uniref:Glutathione S-transferase UstS-like C-terminal domain-containing protein n=1 Tax=Cylindrodendrum hubeiense TaxID=595255 RepID=A0A9P5LI79_9HYPO|nr:hypothetical protein G7Z17_g3377 [Cylindrodendrum hubeiense]